MADESKTPKAEKGKPYFERLVEHIMSKNFVNRAEIVVALEEFKDINAKKPKYYERLDGANLDPKIVPFGKYKGKTVVDLIASDRQYLEWLVKQKWMDNFSGLRDELATHGIGRVTPLVADDEISKLRAKLALLEGK